MLLPQAPGLHEIHQRVEKLLSVLQAQQFFPLQQGGGTGGGPAKPYAFAFESCGSALNAYRERLPKVIELARTMAMAELEIKGEYNESRHDPIFDRIHRLVGRKRARLKLNRIHQPVCPRRTRVRQCIRRLFRKPNLFIIKTTAY